MGCQRRSNLRWARPVCLLLGSFLLVTLVTARLPQQRIGCDFFSFWTAGELLASGQNPYDAGLQASVQHRHGWDRQVHGRGQYDFMPFYYPPWLGLAFTALVPLGHHSAKVVWVALDFELLLVSGYLLRDAAPGAPWWVSVIGVPAFVFSVFSALLGQTSPLVLFLIVASSRLVEQRYDRLAGGLLACLTIKPQLSAVLLAGMLLWSIRQGRWRIVQGFCLILGLFCLVSLLLLPFWPVEILAAIRQNPPPTAYYPSVGATWLSALETIGIRGWCLPVLYSAVVLPLSVLVLRSALAGGCRARDLMALGVLAAFFVAPYGRPYDFPILLMPLLLLPEQRISQKKLLAVVVLNILTIIQIMIYIKFFGDINLAINELGVTFFWIPLTLTAAWLTLDSRTRSLLLHRSPAACPHP